MGGPSCLWFYFYFIKLGKLKGVSLVLFCVWNQGLAWKFEVEGIDGFRAERPGARRTRPIRRGLKCSLARSAGLIPVAVDQPPDFDECIALFSANPKLSRGIERGCYTREGSNVFARLMIRAIAAAISSRIAVPATKTVTKAMSKAVLA